VPIHAPNTEAGDKDRNGWLIERPIAPIRAQPVAGS
jgi:hypothetical protein